MVMVFIFKSVRADKQFSTGQHESHKERKTGINKARKDAFTARNLAKKDGGMVVATSAKKNTNTRDTCGKQKIINDCDEKAPN